VYIEMNIADVYENDKILIELRNEQKEFLDIVRKGYEKIAIRQKEVSDVYKKEQENIDDKKYLNLKKFCSCMNSDRKIFLITVETEEYGVSDTIGWTTKETVADSIVKEANKLCAKNSPFDYTELKNNFENIKQKCKNKNN
jgi:hypothetical protein